MRFPPERESAYREHMFARERPRLRVFVLIAAPTLLLFALLQAPLSGLPASTWFAKPLVYVLAAALLCVVLWMRTMTRPAAFAWSGVLLLTLFCLSCALVVDPRPEMVAMSQPLFVAPPMVTAPFWAYRRTVLAAVTGGYLAGCVALLRADAGDALWLGFGVQAVLGALVGLLLHSVFDEVRRVHFLAEEELLQRVRLDSLTQLMNRRHFVESGEMMIAAMPASGVLSACFVDLDHFKRVNDNGGHRIGDLVLWKPRAACSRWRAKGGWWRGWAARSSHCCCPTPRWRMPRCWRIRCARTSPRSASKAFRSRPASAWPSGARANRCRNCCIAPTWRCWKPSAAAATGSWSGRPG